MSSGPVSPPRPPIPPGRPDAPGRASPAGPPSSAHQAALLDFKGSLLEGGLPAGLRFMNQRVQHRFTAVYLLRDSVMHNAGLFDRDQHYDTSDLERVPLQESFCQFVFRDGSFATSDSTNDRRLDGHVNQGVMVSYVALPLSFRGDDLMGTFCHFDFAPRPLLADDEYVFMHLVARVLPDYVRPRGSNNGRGLP